MSSQSWTRMTLSEICEKPQYGWTTSAAKTGSIRLLRTTDITKPPFTWDSVPFCAEAPEDPEKYLLAEDDIVISRAGSIGVSFRVTKAMEPAVFASYLIRVKPRKDVVDPGYLGLFLKSPDYWSQLRPMSAGATLANINAKKLAAIEVPIPPLHEQRRIVAELEEQLGHHEATRTRLQKVHVDAGYLRHTIIQKMSAELERFPCQAVTEVCEVYQPKTIATKNLDPNGEFPVFGANGQIGRYGEFNHEFREVTITCRGATSGTVNVIPPKSWITGNAMVVSPKTEELSKGFLAAYLSAVDMTPFISGTAQPQITRTNLRALQVPIAPRDVQMSFVSKISDLNQALEALIAEVSAAQRLLDQAKASILHRSISSPREDS